MAGKSETLVSRLGLYEKLLECLVPGEDYVAYGVVEDRFCEMFPDETHVLLKEKGHVWRDPSHRSTKTSMSRYLARCLSRLAIKHEVEKSEGPAEGQWAYLGRYSYWRRA